MLYFPLEENLKDEISGLYEDEIKIVNLIREGKMTQKAFSIESHWEIEQKNNKKELVCKLISAKLISKFKF